MYNKHEIQWDQAASWSLWTPSPKTLNSLTTKKQMTKFLYAKFKKWVKSKLYHIKNSKTRGQKVYI